MVTVGRYRVSIRWQGVANIAWGAVIVTLLIAIFVTVGYGVFRHTGLEPNAQSGVILFIDTLLLGAITAAAVVLLTLFTVMLVAVTLDALFRLEKLDQEADDGS